MRVNIKNIAREVVRVRVQQMAVNELHKNGKFKIPIHFGFGYEALAVAVSSVMGRADQLILTHRNIAYNIAREDTLKCFFDEYALKRSGVASGRYGSMNLINPSCGVLYTSSILANQFPVAVGAALGNNLHGTQSIAIVSGGDGAIEEGAFYESVLMAASIKAPVLFLIENNGWSMHTSIRERRVEIDLKKLVGSLSIPYIHLKGNNVFTYIQTFARARKQILTSRMPLCLEVKVHTLGDWYDMKNPLYPKGKFVKYHTGASPSVTLSEKVVLQKNAGDPLFVLGKLVSPTAIQKIAVRELALVKKEMYDLS